MLRDRTERAWFGRVLRPVKLQKKTKISTAAEYSHLRVTHSYVDAGLRQHVRG